MSNFLNNNYKCMAVLQCLLNKNNYINYIAKYFVHTRNFSTSKRMYFQKVTFDKLVRLDITGLQPRILNYINESTNYSNPINTNLNLIRKIYKFENLRNIKNGELSILICSLRDPDFRGNFKSYLKKLDKECCARLPELKTQEIFNYLNNFVYIVPNIITKLSFYEKAMQKMQFYLEQCSKNELVQLSFYVGLQKKSAESQRILKHCLNKFNTTYVNNLTAYDVLIICNSCFKTSIKIDKKKMLNKIIEVLYNNLDIVSDSAIFVTLIKSLRHNRYYNDELLRTISYTIFFNRTIEKYNFTVCSHIIALYADSLYYDENLLELLINKCVEQLRDEQNNVKAINYSSQIRMKDIARFLWSISYLDHQFSDLNTMIGDLIIPFLKHQIASGELDRNIEYFIDSLLSIWMLEYKPNADFLTSIITKHSVYLIYGKQKRRYVARLNLLLTCIKWENSEVFSKINVVPSEPTINKDLANDFKDRPYLKSIYDALCNIIKVNKNINIEKFAYTKPVPYLNIVGITGYDSKGNIRVFIELIDASVQITNQTIKSHGFMTLKLRLLRTLKKSVITIIQEDLEELEPKEIEIFLNRKLNTNLT